MCMGGEIGRGGGLFSPRADTQEEQQTDNTLEQKPCVCVRACVHPN